MSDLSGGMQKLRARRARASVFIVHSGITFAVAEAIASSMPERSLIVTVSARGAWKLTRGTQVTVGARFPPISRQTVFQTRAIRRDLEHRLRRATRGRPFELYAPQLSQVEYRAIAAMKDCKAVNFIEEGLLSTRTPPSTRRVRLSLRSKILSVVAYGWSSRFGFLDSVYDDYFPSDWTTKFFGVMEDSFPWSRDRTLVDYRNGQRLSVRAASVLIVDRFDETSDGSVARIALHLARVISEHGGVGERGLAVKTHPDQSDAATNELTTRLSALCGVHVETLPREACLELIEPGHSVFVARSSLARYLPLTDSKVIQYGSEQSA